MSAEQRVLQTLKLNLRLSSLSATHTINNTIDGCATLSFSLFFFAKKTTNVRANVSKISWKRNDKTWQIYTCE